MSAVLSDVVVVELTHVLAGPYCAMMLGDLGARVIKVRLQEARALTISGSIAISTASRSILCSPRGKRNCWNCCARRRS